MAYIDHIRSCNRHDLSAYIPLRVDGVVVGSVKPAFAEQLLQWPALFRMIADALILQPGNGNLVQRSEPLARVLQQLYEQDQLSHLMGELYPVTAGDRQRPLLLIDRAAAAHFGIRTFGQHINGLVQDAQGLMMWIGRRSADRRHAPNALDQLVAGGLPWGISLQDNLAKECWEEASISRQLALQARPTGAVSYLAESEHGIKPDTLFCYDLHLPADFVPECTDGEVSEFYLWPVEQVMEEVQGDSRFKLNCNLVVIDLLIRHGYIDPQQDGYLELLNGLHQAHSALA